MINTRTWLTSPPPVLFRSINQYSRFKPQTNFSNLKISKPLTKSDEVFSEFIAENSIKAKSDWKRIREELMKNSRQITPLNIDSMAINYCLTKKLYKEAVSYMDFINEENIKPNLATIGKYFRLFYYLYLENLLTKQQEDMILSLYKELKDRYKILDSITNENLILALSVTKEWKQCLTLLEDIKIACIPNSASYSAIISAAFRNNEHKLGWQFLDEMLENNRIPSNECYLSYVQSCSNIKNESDKLEKLEELFNFFGNYDTKCNERVAKEICEIMHSLKYDAEYTIINNRGICKHCKQILQKYELTETEFKELKESFFNNVIIGKNVFCKTTPLELKNFKIFTDNMESFDVVIDGLNVAYSAGAKHSRNVLASMVSSVVHHFKQKNMNVLLLGRKHMASWPKPYWYNITKNAKVFLTENLSQDDPYLLYCALHSGLNTIIVSRDLMRSHLFLLKNPQHKRLFNRWLAQSRHEFLYAGEDGKVVFKYPLQFMISAQKNEACWHIPFESNSQDKQVQWICTKKSSRHN